MARVVFTPNLQRHVICPPAEVIGATVREVLAFGSTTGSLWISEDAGTRWQRLSAELPPVHAVRFGAQTA